MAPKPCIAVQQDVDDVPIGSFWGEVQVSTHKALGCSGVITNGGLRDLDEVQAMGFGYFASCVLVSHAYVHTIEFDMPVTVGGLVVRPGDLLHADKHGVVLIPEEIAPKIAEACRKVQYYEEPVIKGCKARFETGITIEELTGLRQEMAKRR
jgi:regulator of RNase E activity RraA